MNPTQRERGMALGDLLHGLVAGPLDAAGRQLQITGIYDDSRRVKPGGLFIALRGGAADGSRFIPDALQAGARAIVGEDLPQVPGALMIRVADARAALATIAARWHGLDRAPSFKLLAVTGTNGKSTTAYMAAAILRAAGMRCGLLGTVQYDLCARTVRAELTTPGALELCGYLRECLDAGAQAAVMEASSHALDQKRTDGLRFAAAAFTNLTQDHLDYHGTLDAYRAAKARLFSGLDPSATAVVNADDPAHEDMIRGLRGRVVKYGISGRAELNARITRDTIAGTLYRMEFNGTRLVLENALVGRHNVYNALAAAGLALAIGIEPAAIERGLSAVRNIPGRLQRVMCLPEVEVFVDYAHTDDALRNVLSVLRPLTKSRLIVVFGCGGDRDRGKRPKMAAAVAQYADLIVVTSDNPRTEDAGAIINDILAGFDAAARRKVTVEADRRAAIGAALASARPGDVVLLAGKGHEDYQILGRQKVHFDDVEVALQAATELSGAASGAERA